MELTIKINTNSDAFLDNINPELSRILFRVVSALDYGTDLSKLGKYSLVDINGNTAGYLTLKEKTENTDLQKARMKLSIIRAEATTGLFNTKES